jgi:hypothetical protein
VTPSNERLLAHIRSIRDKIFIAIRQLEELGVGPKDVPAEDFDAVGEAIGLLEGMDQAYRQGDELPDQVAEKMDRELQKTELIARHHVGHMIAHVARTRGVSAKGDAGVASVRCPCGSGKAFSECCGSGAVPAG